MSDSQAPLRIGVIGAGARSIHAYVNQLESFEKPTVLAGVADPSEESVRRCREAVARQDGTVPAYSDWREMLEKEDAFDGMVIASPNHLHHESAVACMERGIRSIMLEKPIATTPEDSRDIVRVANETGAFVQLGFVLRSAPFYRKVKELLDAGTTGRILSVDADELVSFGVTSVLFRSPWRRYSRFSGGALLEKCCHDMDILNWFVEARPIRVNSFGSQTVFGAMPYLPESCSECELREKCCYARADEAKQDAGEALMNRYMRELGDCIFNTGSDCVDHQSVQILYENDAVVNFLMDYHTGGSRAGRNLHIVGVDGRIWGNLEENEIHVHDNATGEETVHTPTLDGSGHGGGDRAHAHTFLRSLVEENVEPVASVWDGYLGAMVCFAADLSRVERRQVGLEYASTDGVELL